MNEPSKKLASPFTLESLPIEFQLRSPSCDGQARILCALVDLGIEY